MLKPFVEKLTLSEGTSFVARTYTTPLFEVPWHKHIEYELILFLEGNGHCFVGNYTGEFEIGDIFFLGANLPHTFQKRYEEMITSAVVIQFRDDFMGKKLTDIPECHEFEKLFSLSMKGLRVTGNLKNKLRPMIAGLEAEHGPARISLLFECLRLLNADGHLEELASESYRQLKHGDQERIDNVIQYSIRNFQESIKLSTIAKIANMSVPAFCSYFKKSTKKTYIDYLNEIRVGYACSLLVESTLSISEICFKSGFNTHANFYKQFDRIKKQKPSDFRNHFRV